MAGIHHVFTPVKLGMIASVGFENFICIGELCSNIAQGAASAAVAVKSKNKILLLLRQFLHCLQELPSQHFMV